MCKAFFTLFRFNHRCDAHCYRAILGKWIWLTLQFGWMTKMVWNLSIHYDWMDIYTMIYLFPNLNISRSQSPRGWKIQNNWVQMLHIWTWFFWRFFNFPWNTFSSQNGRFVLKRPWKGTQKQGANPPILSRLPGWGGRWAHPFISLHIPQLFLESQ